MSKIIEISHLSAGYDRQPIIEDIDLTVNDRDFLGIIGPNGGGKTTFIKVILGLIKPMKGQVRFFSDGLPTENISIGYLPQRSNIDHKFPITVLEVVLSGMSDGLSLRGFGKPTKLQIERVNEVLHQTGMYEYRNRAIGELSGGQMQRVLLGRAIINRPRLLVLDEPNSYIDKRFEERLYELLHEFNKTGTILLVSHELRSLLEMVNRSICIDGTLKPVDMNCPYHHHDHLHHLIDPESLR
jgi:ABC-type Mn/Zn transport systems, ATPase component